MAKKFERYLGNGLYTIPEAALYARISTSMMSRWLFSSRRGKAVIEPQFGPSDKVVSFLDLIQTLAIRQIRLQRQVPLEKIRQAIDVAKREFKIDYPFARVHCTYLLADELVIRPKPDSYVFMEASGKHRGQRLFPFVELYLNDLTFDQDGLANEYRIFERDRIPITLNPHRGFGEPLLPSGYSALVIRDAILAEGSLSLAAKAYGISEKEAEAAYYFADHLDRIAA